MAEGVETLLVAESLKEFCKSVDKSNLGYVPIRLIKIINPDTVRFSMIEFREFNNLMRDIEYSKIYSFGQYIFIPSKDKHYLIVHLIENDGFSFNQGEHSTVQYRIGNYDLFYNKNGFVGIHALASSNPETLTRTLAYVLKRSTDWQNSNASYNFAEIIFRNCELGIDGYSNYKKKEIGRMIIKQTLIAGIGYVYLSEGLYVSKIHPKTKIKDLSKEQVIGLIKNCQKIMWESYKLGGIDFEGISNFGKKGLGKKVLKLYQKNGILCQTCKQSIVQNNFNYFYCPKCQLLKKEE